MSQLKERIIKLSTNQDWEAAKLEWSLHNIYVDTVFKKCLCGHYPIKEVCELQNKHSNEIAIVGNCCVKKFFDLESEKLFRNLRKCFKEENTLLTDALLDFAFKHNLINANDKHFYYNMRKILKAGTYVNGNQEYKMKHMHKTILNRFKR